MVVNILNVEVPGRVKSYSIDSDGGGRGHRVGIAVVTTRSRSCICRDDAGSHRHFTDTVVGLIPNVDVTRRVHGHPPRIVKIRIGRLNKIRVIVPGRAVSGHRRDDAGSCKDASSGCDFTDTLVALICNVQVARTVQGQSSRAVQGRIGGGATVPAETAGAIVPHHRRDDSAVGRRDDAGNCCHFTYAVVAGIRNVHVA